ncbi:MAG TPA: AMIN domain-containing protein [Gemmatimonadaceae bacterium]|nr:AMIN domain-containing protein [Gemmatimonadaceae bacterium]
MTRAVLLAAAAAAVALPPSGRAAISDASSATRAGAVTAVSVSPASGRTEVLISFDGDVEVSDFALSAPHRIVVDISPATLKLSPRLYDGVVRGGITSVRVAQFKANTVRVVLDMSGSSEYSVARAEGGVRLSMESANAAFEPWGLGNVAAAPAVARAVPASRPAPPPRTEVATTRVASTANTVSDAAMSARVSSLSPMQQTGQRITISFRDTPLRDVLSQFAVFSGQSIVPGAGVGNAPVSAEIIDEPWQRALNTILQSQGLAAVFDDGRIIRVESYATIQQRAASEPLVKRMVPLNYIRAAEIAPTVQALLSRDCGAGSVAIVGAPAGDAGAAAAGAGATGAAGAAGGAASPPTVAQGLSNLPTPSSGCQPRGSVVPEAQTNQLIITEVQSKVDTLIAYVQSFDVRTQQVNISTKIISIDRTTTNALGISYDLSTPSTFFNTLMPGTNPITGNPATGEAVITVGGDAFAGVANASKSFAANSALNLLYTTAIGGYALTAFIDALAQENLTDIQVQPSVNTLDKRAAEIFVGDRVAFLITPPTAVGAIQNSAPQISSQQIGSRLRVTPSISANRTIRLEVAIENSSLTSLTEAGPTSSERTASTVVLVQDGETAVIGGLTQVTTRKSRRGIPLLMQLPLIGRLFAENESIERNSDLLVLITPTILDDPPTGGR